MHTVYIMQNHNTKWIDTLEEWMALKKAFKRKKKGRGWSEWSVVISIACSGSIQLDYLRDHFP